MTEVTARRVAVHGAVQGVGYRVSCQREASKHGLVGWVRNRSDGAVEAWFEGSPRDIEQMVAWAGSGPKSADVERTDVEEVEPAGLATFEVRG